MISKLNKLFYEKGKVIDMYSSSSSQQHLHADFRSKKLIDKSFTPKIDSANTFLTKFQTALKELRTLTAGCNSDLLDGYTISEQLIYMEGIANNFKHIFKLIKRSISNTEKELKEAEEEKFNRTIQVKEKEMVA